MRIYLEFILQTTTLQKYTKAEMTLVLLGILLKDLNIWALEPLDVPIVVPHHPPAVDVVTHPGEVHQSSEDSLQVNVVAEDEPETKASLTHTENRPEHHPGQHEAPHVIPDAPDEENGGDQHGCEHDDTEPPGVRGLAVQGCLKQGQIELARISTIEQIDEIGDDDDTHGDGVDGDGVGARSDG